MEKIKTVVLNNFSTVFYSMLLLGTSLFLLMLRLKITNSFFLLFLVWNLFLAWIPYAVSSLLLYKKNIPKMITILGFGVWLLFLPNAPYIVTDLIHLQQTNERILLFDILVISSFAICGLYAYLVSISQIRMLMTQHISEVKSKYFIICIHFLCGFGVYLGRFLRFNSWDLVQNPLGLMESMIVSFKNPLAILITLSFGFLLLLLFNGYKKRSTLFKD